MNGARSISMRKGYLLTALATAVLLAASSGTALAQVTGVTSHGDRGVLVSVPSKVTEGETATINVSVMGTVAVDATATTVMVTITPLDTQVEKGANGPFEAEDNDFSLYPRDATTGAAEVELEFPAGPASGSAASYTRRDTIELDTTYDRDAEDEYVTFTVMVSSLTTGPSEFQKTTTIDDADTQNYVMNLRRRDTYVEGGTITVELEAEPAHVQGAGSIRLRVADQDGNLSRNYTVDTVQPIRVPADADAPNLPAEAVITVKANDKNRVADTVTIEALMGTAGDYTTVASVDVTVDDIHMLPGAGAITAVAKDKARGGKTVTEIVEGGDPAYLTVTVDRGTARSGITDEDLTVEIRQDNAAQVGDYDLSVSRFSLEGMSSGKQSNDVGLEIALSALDDDDVGAEDLVLNLEVSGVAGNGTSTSTGTFTIKIVDDTEPKVSPKSEAEAYPMIRAALGKDPETTVMNPGETGTIMMGDLFTTMDGYTASYKVSESGGAVSVTAPGDMVTIAANAAGTSKVTVTATAEMAASSFLPEQTVSDVASITFEVMVEEGMTEPVPALPLVAQLLLALFMMAGGARLYRRRQG